MWLQNKLGIKTQLILLVSAIGIVFSIAGFRYYRYDYNTTRTEKFTNLQAIADLKAEQLIQWHKERKSEATFFTTISPNIEIAREIAFGDFHNASFYKESLQQIMTNNRYQNIFMLSANQHIIFSVYTESEIIVDSITFHYFKKVFQERKIQFTDFYYCTHHQAIHFDIIAPIFDIHNDVIATLVFRVNPNDYLYPLLQKLPTESRSAETYIVRKEADSVLYLNNLRHIPNSALKVKKSLLEKENSAAMAVTGFEGNTEAKDYRGINVLSNIRKIKGTPWYILSEIDQREAYAELRLRTILITVLILLSTLFVGAVTAWIYHYRQRNIFRELFKNREMLHESQEALKATLYSIGEGVVTTDLNGKIERINTMAEKLSGWNEKEAYGKHIDTIFKIVHEETRKTKENPIAQVVQSGKITELSDNALLIHRNKTEIPITESAAPIKDSRGKIQGVVIILNDQSTKRHNEKMLEFRLNLIEFSTNHPTNELLKMAIDGMCKIMNSPLGFIQLVNEKNGTSKIEAWSDQTISECKITKAKHHLFTHQSGIWSESIQKRETIINNNASSKHKNIPDGHPQLTRLMIVPVFRKNTIVATVGIANKSNNYTQSDSESLKLLSDIAWTIVEGKKKEIELIESEERYRLVLDNSIDAIFLSEPTGKILSANMAACKMFGMTEQEIIQSGREKIVDQNDSRLPGLLKEREQQGVIQGELNFVRKNGNVFPAEITSAMFYNSNGEKRASLIIRDITQRIETEKQIREERLLLRTLIDNLPDAIYVKNTKGQKILSNLADLNDMGISNEQEIIGKTDLEIYANEHGKQGYNEDMEVLETGKTILNKEVYSILKNNQKQWKLISKIPLTDENKKITGLVGFTRNITQRKFNEEIQNILYQIAIASMSAKDVSELLITVREQLSKVIDTTNFYVAQYIPEKDTLEKVIFVNEKYTINEWSIHNSLSGMVVKSGKTIILNEAEINELTVKHHKRPDYIPAKSWIGVPLKVNEMILGVVVLQNYNKTHVFEKHHAQLLELVAHELVVVIQRAKMIEDVIAAKEKAEENDRLKSAFLANISHEIRTPMNGILGFMELLGEKNIAPKEREKYLEIMNKSGQRLLDTINDIIEISKLESGQVELNISKVNISELLYDQLTFFTQQAERKSLKIRLSEVPENVLSINTDKYKIEAILTNILNNAIKYTKQGHIDFGAKIKNNELEFFVKDTGIGIKPEKQKTIFERFIQDDQYITRPQEGVGLGLSIVKAYINMLGGKIWLESEVEKGSCFYFSIPLNA